MDRTEKQKQDFTNNTKLMKVVELLNLYSQLDRYHKFDWWGMETICREIENRINKEA